MSNYDSPQRCVHGKPLKDPCGHCLIEGGTRQVAEEINDSAWQPVPLPEFDAVNRPPHYNQGGVECIDAMKEAFGTEAFENHCVMNAFKYIWRYKGKNGREDLAKAIWYLRMATGDDPRG